MVLLWIRVWDWRLHGYDFRCCFCISCEIAYCLDVYWLLRVGSDVAVCFDGCACLFLRVGVVHIFLFVDFMLANFVICL